MTVSSYNANAAPRRSISLRHPWIALVGPAFAVSIGYIDPGNWATDLGAGIFGYSLLWVIFAADAIAVVLQLAVSRLTLDAGVDLATLIARRWPRWRMSFWLIFQAAAIATDLAEFGGIVLGIRMLFHASVVASVVIGLAIVAALLVLTRRGAKHLEYFLVGAVVVIGLGCLFDVRIIGPDWSKIVLGSIVPSIPAPGAVVLIVGIIGATVMPHNLFLHSSLLAREFRSGGEQARRRNGFFTKETIFALNLAALINAAILIVGVALHGADGSIERAFGELLRFGVFASLVFGLALLFSGIASSLTATAAGNSIFAAFSPIHVPPPIRRAVTLVPAALAIGAGANIMQLLVWSQVALAFVLPVVMVPMLFLMFEQRSIRGESGATRLLYLATTASIVCVGFDAVMVAQLV